MSAPSMLQNGFDDGKHQKVSGIKLIEKPLQASPFLPVIESKRDETEPCRAVIPHRSRQSEKGHNRRAAYKGMLLTEQIEKENPFPKKTSRKRNEEKQRDKDLRKGKSKKYKGKKSNKKNKKKRRK
jgi:hypothetical protein